MDEATANLDSKISADIENSILRIEQLTVFVVTHRLQEQMLNKYDEIIVLESGRIVERGSFKQLIKKQESFYELYTASV